MKRVTITLARLVRETLTLTVEVADDVDLDAVPGFLYDRGETDNKCWDADVEFGCDEGTHDVSAAEDDDATEVVVTLNESGHLHARFIG